MAGRTVTNEAGEVVYEVSILIILANGWKLDENPLKGKSYYVSILIILANGWKILILQTVIFFFTCFNPHHTGEWLEVLFCLFYIVKLTRFNPHHAGEWLEGMGERTGGNVCTSGGVAILLLLANG